MGDQETILAFVAGEHSALEKIIHSHTKALQAYCTAILCNKDDAKDAVQETFIKAYLKRKQFDPASSLNAWLYRIAYTSSLDLLRKRNLRNKLLVFCRQNPREKQAETGISEPLASLLLTLSVQERTLLYGKVLEDRS